MPLTLSQCADTRDALSKALYSAIFDWVIKRLNANINSSSGNNDDEEDERAIGVLDVFGCESLCTYTRCAHMQTLCSHTNAVRTYYSVGLRTSRPTHSSSCVSTLPMRACSRPSWMRW